jgi:hypothetical protein
VSVAEGKKKAPNEGLRHRIYRAVKPKKPKRHWVIAIPMALLGTNLEILSRINTLTVLKVGHDNIRVISLAGWSSLWMLPIYGFIGTMLGLMNEKDEASWLRKIGKQRLIWQCLIGWIFILVMELTTGCVLNLQFHLAIWNYDKTWPEGWNILGQVCAQNAFFFFWLTPIAFWIDDMIRHVAYREEKPVPFLWYFCLSKTPEELREKWARLEKSKLNASETTVTGDE